MPQTLNSSYSVENIKSPPKKRGEILFIHYLRQVDYLIPFGLAGLLARFSRNLVELIKNVGVDPKHEADTQTIFHIR